MAALTKKSSSVNVRDRPAAESVRDEEELAALGYRSEFKREFTNLGTISFAFSIMYVFRQHPLDRDILSSLNPNLPLPAYPRGLCSSVSTTFDTPMLLGGPASVVWCWLMGATGCAFIGTSIAELVSAYPTSGGLYSASCYLVPTRWRGPVGYVGEWTVYDAVHCMRIQF